MINHLKEEALGGCAVSQLRLGEAYAKGESVDVDFFEAMHWFKRSANQGNAEAQKQVALLYERGVAGDLDAAITWFTKCALREDNEDQDDSDVQCNLALLLRRRNASGDEGKAKRWMETSALQGHAEAQFLLAKTYQSDDKFKSNDQEVYRWYKMAADQGHTKALYEVGLLRAKGQGVDKNIKEAINLFWAAADQGSISAYLQLGEMYATGVGAPKNDDNAFECFSKAAEAGDARGQNGMGKVLYARGDHDEAFKWFLAAAEQGFANAQHNVAEMYEDGEGVGEDAEIAAMWFRKSAEQESSDSQLKLGLMYRKGNGVPENQSKAYQWLLLAQANGEPDATSEVQKIEKTLTPSERRRGQKAANDFSRAPRPRL